ncbi:hypothetical protein O6R05_07505 [Peptoniphilus equinus]|uniref:Uncharacterized protein n=1 Tax=Peptoniphilus equinus TaxID=3016343 RepID=A0ABY7QSU2_9FIRM|nr:hypothetical protein [Peptoniphilus equinus]WBW49839.1 hypothetical protein O6R05_07505 [Peptoniphilus equinus]
MMLKVKKWGLYTLTSLCLIAIIVCVICDYAMTKTLTWSLIVILSLIAGWLVMAPCFIAKSKAIKKSLIVSSIILIPFLAGLSALLKLPLILSMGSCIAGLSIAAAWGIYGVLVKYQKRIFLALALSLLIAIPLVCGITHITAYFIKSFPMDIVSDLFHIITTLVLSGTCLMIDAIKLHRDTVRKAQTGL